MFHRMLAAALLASLAPAQETAQSRPRPRIGLVLSGGGARGAAHAGVLEVLEELRIPVHCIAGTSMGAIVGGLYAYGHAPRDLQNLLTRAGSSRDWADLLHDGPWREDLDFRRKQDDRSFLAKLRVGVRDGGLAFPKGFIQGQNLETELRFLTLSAHDMKSFDQLPIPFRCVAVEIGTGKQVVLGKGNLADAMRASMSLPAVFAPVTIDGKELVDGGLLNNIPIDVARAMGVDVLIVVNIGTPLDPDTKVKDLFGVTGQMVAILTEQNVIKALAAIGPDDVLIQPDLGNLTAADFERAAETIAIGVATARTATEKLRRFSVSPEEYAGFLRRQRRPPAAMPRIRQVLVANDSDLGDQVLRSRIRLQPGEPLDEEQFREDLNQIYGIDDFQRVAFALRDVQEGLADLHLDAQAKDWGPSYLRFGIRLESVVGGDSVFDLGGQYTARELNALGGEWRNELRAGNKNLLSSEFYQPLEATGRWFVAPRVEGVSEPFRVYQGDQRVAEGQVHYGTLALDAGRQVGSWAELRLGAEWTLGQVDTQLASVPVQDFDFDDAVVRARLQIDTLDDARFPSRGTAGQVEWRHSVPDLGADTRYQRLEVALAQAIPWGKTAFIPMLRFETALSDVLPIYTQPTLGGFLRLSGLARDQLRGQHTGFVALAVRHRVTEENLFLGLPFYVGGSVETGNAWNRGSQIGNDPRLAGSVYLGFDTPLGPIYMAYGLADAGDQAFYFFLGPIFD